MNGFEYCILGGKCQIKLNFFKFIDLFYLIGLGGYNYGMGQNGGKNYVFILDNVICE